VKIVSNVTVSTENESFADPEVMKLSFLHEKATNKKIIRTSIILNIFINQIKFINYIGYIDTDKFKIYFYRMIKKITFNFVWSFVAIIYHLFQI